MLEDWPDFRFRHLDVYRVAMEHLVRVDLILPRIRRKWRATANQLERNSLSILLNVAEGAGEFSPGDKARFYRMALRSGTECAAALEAVAVREPTLRPQAREAAQLTFRIVSMLHRMMPTQFRRQRARSQGSDPTSRPRGTSPSPSPSPEVTASEPVPKRKRRP